MRTFIISLVLFLSIINYSFAYNYYEAGRAEYIKGNYGKANGLFKNELIGNPGNLKCRYIYAQSFVGINDLKSAQREYEKVIEQSPNSEFARLSTIAISKIQGYYSGDSPETLQKVSNQSTKDEYLKKAQHQAKTDMRKTPGLKVTVQRSPIYYSNKYIKIGADYYQQKKYDLAIENYQKATKITPNNYEIIANIAVCYYKLGKYNSSIEYWKKASGLATENFVPYMQIGNIYKIMGKNQQSEEYLKKANELQ